MPGTVPLRVVSGEIVMLEEELGRGRDVGLWLGDDAGAGADARAGACVFEAATGGSFALILAALAFILALVFALVGALEAGSVLEVGSGSGSSEAVKTVALGKPGCVETESCAGELPVAGSGSGSGSADAVSGAIDVSTMVSEDMVGGGGIVAAGELKIDTVERVVGSVACPAGISVVMAGSAGCAAAETRTGGAEMVAADETASVVSESRGLAGLGGPNGLGGPKTGGPTWKSGRPYPPALNCRFAGAAAESGELVRRASRPKDIREAMVAV